MIASEVPPDQERKYRVLDSDDLVESVASDSDNGAWHAEDLRALEHELFYQYARGMRDASRRLVKK